MVDAYNAWGGYVIGFTAIETKPPGFTRDLDLQEAMRRQLEEGRLGAQIMAELISSGANIAFGLGWAPGRLGAANTSFDWGLKALLDGFEAGQRR